MLINQTKIIPPHGGYKKLLSYQMAEIVYDLTVQFCKTYMTYKTNMSHRTVDQMIQAARSGKQNTCPPVASALGACRRVTEGTKELLVDYQDFLRTKKLLLWEKDDAGAKAVRALSYQSNKSYKTYMTYMSNPEKAANTMICIIHQTNYLLDKQLAALDKAFLEDGGFTERLYRARKARL